MWAYLIENRYLISMIGMLLTMLFGMAFMMGDKLSSVISRLLSFSLRFIPLYIFVGVIFFGIKYISH